jgi:hypothetical protein
MQQELVLITYKAHQKDLLYGVGFTSQQLMRSTINSNRFQTLFESVLWLH